MQRNATEAARSGDLEHWVSSRRERLEQRRGIALPVAIYRRYREIDGRNFAILIATKLFLSFMPLAILGFAATTAFAKKRSFAEVVTAQFGLRGAAAQQVHHAFATASQAKVAIGLVAILGFAYSGYDVPATLQQVYARAWRTERLSGSRAWVRGGVWLAFFVAMTTLGEQISVARARLPFYAAVLSWPLAVGTAFVVWLVTPRLLLHRDLSWRELVPSGLLGMAMSAGLRALSRWAMPRWLTQYAHPFGSIGVAMGIVFWLLLTCYSWVLIAAATAVMWEHAAEPDEIEALELGGDATDPPDAGS